MADHADLIARLVTVKDDAVVNSLQVDQEYAVGPADRQAGADERAAIERTIDDAIAALRAIPRWQPISTAPEDGPEILLWTDEGVAGGAGCAVGYYDEGTWRRIGLEPVRHPTHWMPLPDPPK